MKWWNLEWVCPPNLQSLFTWWFNVKYKSIEKGCWDALFPAVLWSIWKSRNGRVFNGKIPSMAEVMDLVKCRTAMWTKASYEVKEYSVADLVRCLDGIGKMKVRKV